jgi:hypothetical protein
MIDIKKFQPGASPILLNATTPAANGTFTQTLNQASSSSPLYDVRIVNTGTIGQTAFILWGGTNGSITATTTTGQPVLGNTEKTFNMGQYAQVFSAIMLAGSANIYVTPGQGE